MAVQAVGGVGASGSIVPVNINDVERVGAGAAARRAQAGAGDSSSHATIVISKVTRTKDDGSTVTTITYADGHTETETTPPRFSANENQRAQENPNRGVQAGESLNGSTQPTQGVQAGGSLNTGANGDEGRITGVDILA